MKKRKITNITKNTKEGCYMARIMRAGEKHQKNFPAKKHGGWGEARKLALEWVEEMKKELPSLSETTYNQMTKKNKSGVVGVTIRGLNVVRPSGIKYYYWTWIAKWPSCKYKGGMRFNVGNMWSDEDAFTLAVLARENQLDDRPKVVALFESIKGTQKHEDILARKLQYLDWE